MNVSVREVLDLAERSFRVAGFPEGPARAIAETIWWLEAYRGTGLTTLESLLADIESLDRSRVSLEDHGPMVSVLDSDGQPSIVSANPAVDLGCSHASRNGVGVVQTGIAPEGGTLAALGHEAYRAGQRGYVSVVLYASEAGTGTVVGVPDTPYPYIVERELDAPSESHAALATVLDAGLRTGDESPLYQALSTEADGDQLPAERSLLAVLLEGALTGMGADREPSPEVVTVCIDPKHTRYAGRGRAVVERFLDERSSAFTHQFHPADVRERVSGLVTDGVDVDESVYEPVFEYSGGILAPEFEGSYQGAGFDIIE